jgi:hypothetical protein
MGNSLTYVIAFWGVLGWFVIFRLVCGFVVLVVGRRIV